MTSKLESLIAEARRQAENLPTKSGPAADLIPGYELIRELHRGGQGVVYLAHQRATRRNVAIKILREGPFAGPEERARFDREVQVLAALKHPNIVAIHDSGSVLGSFYFVMDYIDGLPLNQWAARERTKMAESPARKLRQIGKRGNLAKLLHVFAKICDAVNVTHQRGVIHRDLKPTNIRVDAADEPYILDFGLAKLAPGTAIAPETATVTVAGEFLGTLAWASPEQVAQSAYHADTRSDIYAVGLMMYQALIGKMPYSVESSVGGMIHAIANTEPARLRVLGQDVDKDLETIVLQCLRKDPDRRYQTMAALADDLRHYLRYEPISARRESGWYSLRMFARRHRIAVGITGVLASLLIAASVLLAFLYVRARANERLALQRADETRRVAEFQAAQLAGIDTAAMGLQMREALLSQAQQGLAINETAADEAGHSTPLPLETALESVNFTDLALHTLEENIFRGAISAIDGQFDKQPIVRAALLQTLADTMRRLGLLDQAVVPQQVALQLRREHLGSQHPDTLTSLHLSGLLHSDRGERNEALQCMRETLELRRKLLGEEHSDTLTSLNDLGNLLLAMNRFDEAQTAHHQVLEVRQRVLGEEHPDTVTSLANLAALYHQQGELDEASMYYEKALPLMRRVFGNEDAETLTVINNLGHLRRLQGRRDEALEYLQETLDVRRRTLGNKHPRTLNSIDNLAALLVERADLDQAIALRTESLAGYRDSLGEHHPSALRSLVGMGHVLMQAGRLNEAEPFVRRSLALHRQVLGNDHTDTIIAINQMGTLLSQMGKAAEAAECFREALQSSRRAFGNEHSQTASILADLGSASAALGQHDEAESCLTEAISIFRKTLGDNHSETLDALVRLGGVYQARKQFDQALPLIQEARAGFLRSLPSEHPNTLGATLSEGVVWKSLGEWDKALSNYQEALAGYRRVLKDEHPFTLRAVNLLGELSMAKGEPEDAIQFFQESYEVSMRALGPNHLETLRSGINLGHALTEMGQFADAEQHLIEAEANSERLPPRHDLRVRLVRHMVELYKKWETADPDGEHSEQAEKWRNLQAEMAIPADGS